MRIFSFAECVRYVIERPFTFPPPAVVPWCSFSHLVLFSAQIGDAWAIIALCSGRVTMGAEPWPALSLICVSLAVKYTPNERYERQHSSVHDGYCHCSREPAVHLDEIYNTAKRYKEIKFAHNIKNIKMKENEKQ